MKKKNLITKSLLLGLIPFLIGESSSRLCTVLFEKNICPTPTPITTALYTTAIGLAQWLGRPVTTVYVLLQGNVFDYKCYLVPIRVDIILTTCHLALWFCVSFIILKQQKN